jgi:lipoate-protein ligase B
LRLLDLHTLDYLSAWREQERVHEEVLHGAEEAILLVEHPPVITFGRRAEESARHLVASREMLRRMNVDLVESDRGGDITFHGPGQVVAYPIVRLNDHRLSVGAYVKRLEHAVIETLTHFRIEAHLEPGAVGVWTAQGKICALGVRIKRGVSLHGIALNVETDLHYFNLIVPCGLSGRRVTSMRQVLRDHTPSVDEVKGVLADRIRACVAQAHEKNHPE